MPMPGQMTEECLLLTWHKAEGDPVTKGDVLFEIETDKSIMDVEAFHDGVLLKRLVAEGQTVPVNTICAYVGDPGEPIPDQPTTEPVAAPPVASPAASPTADDITGRRPPQDVAPSGPPARRSTGTRTIVAGPDRFRISPRAAGLAAELGLDPGRVVGTGPLGRLIERDVRVASEAHTTPVDVSMDWPNGRPPATLDEPDDGPQPLGTMRQVIARRLTTSYTTTPHFTVTLAVNMTRLVALRTEWRSAGWPISLTDLVMAATAQSLAEFPTVNSRTDGTSVWLRRRVHLGFAVSIPGGLVVPVIRDADRRTLLELHEHAFALAEAARGGRLSPDDMAGGTFTVSNLGMFGVDEFSAIINPGEAAILAVSSVLPVPIAVGEGIGVRQLMKLTLSADHRLVDGELAARFLNAIRRRLEDADAFQVQAVND